ncbi:MAG: FG-GAP-like repeat-containing protein [Candidatus Zixiibacteriota bacterium]
MGQTSLLRRLIALTPIVSVVVLAVSAGGLVPRWALAQSQCLPVRVFTGWAGWPDPGHLGRSIAGAGDVDKDGWADVIIGGWRLAGQSQVDAGQAYVFSGRTGQKLLRFYGEDWGDAFGYAVDGAGDLNGDGYADVVVGAFGNDYWGNGAGRAYVYSGADGRLVYMFSGGLPGDALGSAVAGVGDVNGDGVPDVIVGADREMASGWANGLAYVYSGQDGTVLYEFTAGEFRDEFGWSVSQAADINRDGYCDVVVGAPGGGWTPPYHDGQGRAYVYSGQDGALLHSLSGESTSDLFGFSVAGGADVNGDGYPDVIVGAIWNDSKAWNSGSAYVYSGKTWEVIHKWSGEQEDDRLGQWVDGVGDMDGDGFADVIIGAIRAHVAGEDKGAAYVYSGRTGVMLFRLVGERSGDWFGRTACGLGDINSDGLPDFGIVAPASDAGYTDFGRAYVYMPCRVDVDVLPSQCPNQVTFEREVTVIRPMAAGARGPQNLTAAFVGSPSLDVSTIDPQTILLEGVSPQRVDVQDITAPPWIKETPCDCAVRSPDGYPDLVLTFDLSALDKTIHGPSVLSPSEVVNLTALLKTGEPIIGQDCLHFGLRPIRLAGVEDSLESATILLGNSPNPLNSSTTIAFSLPMSGATQIQVFDVLGRKIATLMDDDLDAGRHQVTWDGTDGERRPVASGIYLYRLTAGSTVETRKMVLLK